MTAEIITIGDELLLGQTVDTNSAWMGQELIKHGIALYRITSISDEANEIKRALDEALSRVDLVLMTGGLGPTRDDITKEVLATFFDMKLVRDEDVLARITAWFEGRGLPMLPVNVDQALLPNDCKVLPNSRGTAMGMWFDERRNGKDQVVVSMPGVPYEMKGLMIEEVIPRVLSKWTMPVRYYRTALTQGVGESFLSAQVAEWEAALAEQGIHIAYLPAPGQVRVRLSASGDDAKLLVDRAYSEFLSLAGDHVVAEEDKPLAQVLVEALTKSGATVATAESCTGGTIASRITAISGSSAVFQGGVVAYANEVKCRLLGVSEDDLQAHGAVSEPVVRQMAAGARERFGTTYALATSGIAGPTGGTAEKPVGTIWIALASEKGTQTRLLQLGNHRGRNIDRTVLECLAWLVRALKEQNSQRS